MEPDQSEVIAFLSRPGAYPDRPDAVDRLETHGALVFLAGEHVYKIKRAVTFSYMDLATLEKRHRMVAREVEINRQFAPSLYIGAVPVTRTADGTLRIGGDGVPVEWAVHMRRFEQSALLSRMVRAGALTSDIAKRLADRVRAMHDQATSHVCDDADGRVGETLAHLASDLGGNDGILSRERVTVFAAAARDQLGRAGGVLQRRGQLGHVRRCHGDLHLNNIVLWRGEPVAFDALEFDERLATVDTFYDLAFLLMDLVHCGAREHACLVLNRYLWRDPPGIEIDALVALPLFLGLRSAIRAMVTAQRADQLTGDDRATKAAEATGFLEDAIAYVNPAPPRLVAVGGHSGTGKSTLAATLAPKLGRAPGALHIRSDLERKAMHGAAETERLPQSCYTHDVTQAVYARAMEKARLALAAGQSVVIDAVFDDPAQRAAIARVTTEAGARFDGIWLTARREALMARVAARTGDASDATPAVVAHQLERDPGLVTWHHVDAGGTPDETCTAAEHLLR